MPSVEGARFALRWSGGDGNGRLEGERNEPIQTDTRYSMVAFSTWSVRRRWKGPMLGLKGPVPGQEGSKNQGTKNTSSEKGGGGMVEVGPIN